MKRVIGVTGGIASGKSHVCKVISNLGYPIIDADQIHREFCEVGKPCYKAIVESFGEDYLTSSGELNKRKLAKLIFKNSAAKMLLNKVTHSIIIEEIKRRIREIEDGLVFVEVPLLFECKMEYLCDKIICVYLKKKLQIERLMAREGIDEDYALAKIHSQMDLYEKQHKADYVIDSLGTLEETEEKVKEVINKIKGEEK